MFAAFARIVSISLPSTSVAGTTGTCASIATRRALALSPNLRMVSAFGPIKAMFAAVQASTKSGFSDKRP